MPEHPIVPLAKTHEIHTGVHEGKIQTYAAGNTGLDRWAAALNKY